MWWTLSVAQDVSARSRQLLAVQSARQRHVVGAERRRLARRERRRRRLGTQRRRRRTVYAATEFSRRVARRRQPASARASLSCDAAAVWWRHHWSRCPATPACDYSVDTATATAVRNLMATPLLCVAYVDVVATLMSSSCCIHDIGSSIVLN